MNFCQLAEKEKQFVTRQRVTPDEIFPFIRGWREKRNFYINKEEKQGEQDIIYIGTC